jgi:nucleotide-binding universal stress UspA family protein
MTSAPTSATRPVVLVPVDSSKDAAMALPVATVLAGLARARLLVAHVAEAKAAAAAAAAPAEIAGVPVEERIGDPAEQILALARETDAQLIVMCKRAAAGARQTLGATAKEVLRGARCPVVLVPPRDGAGPWHLHHVLVPHDGTPATSAAIRPAAALAERAGAELLVAHVTGTGPAPSEPGSITMSRYLDQAHHEWPVWSEEFANRFASICPLGRLHVRLYLAHGEPAAQVVELARKQAMDLIVLAWRGRWEGRAATLKEVLRDAHCPIMVLRTSA